MLDALPLLLFNRLHSSPLSTLSVFPLPVVYLARGIIIPALLTPRPALAVVWISSRKNVMGISLMLAHFAGEGGWMLRKVRG
jgi:hypothetical protein